MTQPTYISDKWAFRYTKDGVHEGGDLAKVKINLNKLLLQGVDKTALIFHDVIIFRSVMTIGRQMVELDNPTGIWSSDGPFSIEQLLEIIKEIPDVSIDAWTQTLNDRVQAIK